MFRMKQKTSYVLVDNVNAQRKSLVAFSGLILSHLRKSLLWNLCVSKPCFSFLALLTLKNTARVLE